MDLTPGSSSRFDCVITPLSASTRGESRADKLDLLTQRLNISRDQRLLASVGVKVTIGAAMCAEGNVEVEGQRMRRHEK
jgi:hypothetical protein